MSFCSMVTMMGGTCGAILVPVSVGVHCDTLIRDEGTLNGVDLADLVDEAWKSGASTVNIYVPAGTSITLDDTITIPAEDLTNTHTFVVSISQSAETDCAAGTAMTMSASPNTTSVVTVDPPEVPDGATSDTFYVDGGLIIGEGVEVNGGIVVGIGAFIDRNP